MKFNSILFCVLFIISANSFTTAKAQVNVNDSLALVDLYNTTNGPSWYHHDNWLAGPVSTWYGIVLTGNRVTHLNLYSNNLTGSVPASIGNLTALQYLYFYYNKIGGSIPASIGNLLQLQDFNISFNQFTGSIPVSIGNLTNLTKLGLWANQLTGSIPDTIGNLNKLTEFIIELNQLSGSIPPSICKLVNLTEFIADRNQLSGSLPDSLGNLINLYDLDLHTNHISGSIPPSVGNLNKLSTLYLDDNQLTGTIPSSLSNMSKIINIHLNNNLLTGNIPALIGKPVHLHELYLDHNELSGHIPNLKHGDVLRLSNNKLSGTIPGSIVSIPGFSYLDVSYNQLSGEIPAAFSTSGLSYIDLSNNRLVQNIYFRFDSVRLNFPYNVSNNKLNFNWIETAAYKYPSLDYAPQAKIAIYQSGSTLHVNAGGTLSNNTYSWYKDNNLVATITGDSTYQPVASGKYYAKVTNARAKRITLRSETTSYTVPLQNSFLASSAKAVSGRFSVYPIPASNIIHLQTNGVAAIVLTNSAGKILLSKSINNSDVININAFANGVYYITNKTTGEVEKIAVVH